jgi:hypothetical protein
MKKLSQATRGKGYSSYSLLTSALDGVRDQRHAPATLYPGKSTPRTNWIEGWVGLRAGLDSEATGKILCLCLGSNPGRPVCSHYTELPRLLHATAVLPSLVRLLKKCEKSERNLVRNSKAVGSETSKPTRTKFYSFLLLHVAYVWSRADIKNVILISKYLFL